MASSRAASIASRSGSPDPLTPQSKIRALLATVESSDEEGGGINVNPTRPSFVQGIGQHDALNNPRSVHDDESDDSEPMIRPRGKLASRMQGAETTTRRTRSPEPAAATARERVRAMLLQRADEANKDDEEESNGDDEDEDLPTAPRRQKRRAAAANMQLDDDSEQELQQQHHRPMSPGLFVSSPVRPSPSKSIGESEDSDNDLPALKSDRFKMLVERKRQERLAREAAEEARKAEQWAQQEKLTSEMDQLASDDGDDGGITDDEGGRRLTQGVRPTRKASRKAIEEMNRETQRMARNMQLAHEAKTKKKISKQSLFQRFNYKPAGHVEPEPEPRTHSSSRPTTPHSDVEMNANDAATPPSSPPALMEISSRIAATTDTVVPTALSTESVRDCAAQLCKGNKPGSPRATADEPGQPQQDLSPDQKQKQNQTRRVRVRLPVLPINSVTLDSDDELQITTTTKNKLDVLFDSIPSKTTSESHSIHALRALAQVKSPGKERLRKPDQSRMTPGELQAHLHFKARQQAKMERERRLELLRGQGIVVQTAAEREKQEQEVEDLVAKARQEAHKIRETEKDEARRLRKMNGEADPLAWDDSEDEEYQDAADEDADADAAELDVSGSEDDEMEDAEDELEQDDHAAGNALFDDEADSAASEREHGEAQEDEDEDEEMAARPAPRQRRARMITTVLSDDEGGVDVTPKPNKLATQVTPAGARVGSLSAPNSVLRSAKKTFIPGFPVRGPAGLGLTQIFAGTMDASQTSDFAGNDPTQSMMPDFEHFPDSNFSATADEPMEEIIIDSQPRQDSLTATQAVQFNLSQSQMHGLGSLINDGMQTQMSEGIELSQDMGLQQHTPLRERYIEPPFSTIETLMAEKQDDEQDMTIQDSPLVRKGRLYRRMNLSTTAGPSEEEEASVPSTKVDAFKALQGAAAAKKMQSRKKPPTANDFDRKKSKAKDMVEEQAEESEDEYAGVGGADGEDSDNESQGSVEDMIDDAAGNDVDGRKLAAFYADRERARDEQQVEKLFKDITKGMLRRKRGADFDLSDSDSDGEARKRMKRRQFAKMQKALFADERVKKIAEDPGNQAFLRSIEDHGSDLDEMDLLDGLDSPSQAQADADTQQSQDNDKDRTEQDGNTIIPNSQFTHVNKPLGELVSENRPPAHLRRTKNGRKPSNIGQVRETLSSLLEEPHGSVIPATEAGSDSEEEESRSTNKENLPPPPRRLPAHLHSAPTTIINRIGLKRQCSSSSSSSSSSSTRMAFTTAATSSSFKVPALLRRATTNSSLGNTSSGSSAAIAAGSTSTSTASGFGEAAKIKKGAGKKSGIGGFAREKETRVLLRESERRREERKVRGAEKRIGMVGGLLGRGAFE
ncbi:hypothetical protein E4U55_005564 [Claviceps digitariae]|nr:hypothetical protein E4U55_005564 [Claviceps digitariae]